MDHHLEILLVILLSIQPVFSTIAINYGLLYPNKYKVPLAAGNDESRIQGTGETWCVACEQVGEQRLQEALNYACGEGGADCRLIQPGFPCYEPNTLVNHASFAFNNYYIKNSKTVGTCDFGGAAYVVTQPPKFGGCEFPTSN